MLIKQFGTETAGFFEVKKASQGIILKNILKTAKIKVTEIVNGAQTIRYPEMTVEQLLTIMKGLENRSVIVEEDGTSGVYTEVMILFSVNGVILFDDDFKYSIEIKDKADHLTAVYNWDNKASQLTSPENGKPISILKGKVGATESEKTVNVAGIDMIYLPDVMPVKLSHNVPNGLDANGRPKTRTVNISPEQIKYYNKGGRIQFVNKSGTYSQGSLKPVYPLNGINELTIHHDTALDADLNYYQIDVR